MDSGTHLVMGIGLFALAHIDPTVAQTSSPYIFLAGTILGSQAPDTDTIYRLISNSQYIKHHRGFSHSLPMLLIWPTLICGLLFLFTPLPDLAHLWLWTFIAVCIHVCIDLFNTYGTQAIRPFSSKWISWNIINIFDPFIFIIHLIGFVLWFVTPIKPEILFMIVYLLIILYVLWRTIIHHNLEKWVKQQSSHKGVYTVTPTYSWNRWNVVLVENEYVKMGEIHNHQLIWTGQLSLGDQSHPAVIASKQSNTIKSFLFFTSYGYPRTFRRSFGYEVHWLDVRYHHKKHYPFVAVVLLDHNLKILNSYVGWLSKEQLKKKVEQLIS